MPMPPPPQGAPGGMPQTQPQASPPGGQDQGSGVSAQEAVSMIKQGFEKLGELMAHAGPNLDPQDIKLFHSAMQSTDLFLNALTSPQQQAAPPKGPGGPMPMNANAQAKPAQY